MRERRVGTTGPVLSVIGLGCNNFGMKIDEAATGEVVGAALDAGITHFDTAEGYGEGRSEEFLGRALGARRDEVVIATKFAPRPAGQPYEPGVLAARIREGCETSLRRLGTDRIDLYYQHFPDPDAPLEEALEALAGLVEDGKVLHVASSNVTAEQITAGARVAEDLGVAGFCGVQAEWNLLARDVEDSVVPAVQAAGMGVVPYYPLASGLLTGKYRAGEPFPPGSRFAQLPYFAQVATDTNLARVEQLRVFAEEQGRSLPELAIAWLIAQPQVASVIAGATTPAQVYSNTSAVDWELTSEELARIEALTMHTVNE